MKNLQNVGFLADTVVKQGSIGNIKVESSQSGEIIGIINPRVPLLSKPNVRIDLSYSMVVSYCKFCTVHLEFSF